ncbi:hypothetical protein EPN96_01920 [bacterium]|nr:MAG: hypothetical protein EPN96_01920 [bacterium]
MVRREEIDKAVKTALSKVLAYGEMCLRPAQFHAYRKQVLDAFGRKGLANELDMIFKSGCNKALERIGPEYSEQGKGAGMSESCQKRKK